ncbi:MAG: hypothetical protein ACFB2W_00525 [Leptolyngbyaceae cyanobacterium]
MVDFQHLTGSYFDSVCQSAGLRQTRLRPLGKTEITPRPLLSHIGQQSTTDIGFQLEDAEFLDTWESSIPKETLRKCLGPQWESIVAADQLWEIHDGTKWKVYRTYGLPQYSNADAGGRVKLVFKADVNTVDSLGLEAPYIP